LSGSRTSREVRIALLCCLCAAIDTRIVFALDPYRTMEQYIVTRWSSRESFPGGAVNAIAQTPDGYLWIGGENGLVRFDGINFRLLDRASTPSLPAGRVLGLLVDSEGVLWVRMESPYLLRYRGGTFNQAYPLDLTRSGATAMARGRHGSMILAPPDGPLRYTAGKFTPVDVSGLAGLAISIAETSDGTVWTGMRDTGLFFSTQDGRGSQVAGLPDQKVNVLLPGTGTDLWIGTDAGLVRWDGREVTRSGVPDQLERSQILALARDRDSNLWISTPSGIARINANGAAMPATTHASLGAVHAIFEDREGNLWFGGTEGLVQARESPFLSYTGVAADGATVHVDGAGRTWIGPSGGGLIWISGTDRGRIREAGLDADVVYSIRSGPGELWIGRRRGGLTHLRETGGVLRARTYTAADGLAPGVVYAMHRSHDGTVWAGTLSGGVSRIHKGRITTFTTADGLTPDAVTTIHETHDGTVWAGTVGGLQAFRGGRWRRYGGEDGLPPGRVNSLATDSNGVLWIGTSAGLFYLLPQVGEARKAAEPLQDEILGLVADSAGNLWVTTGRRVLKLSRAALLEDSKAAATVREFGLADGLPSTQGVRRDHSMTKDPRGRIWFSLQGGLCVVDPSRSGEPAPALVHVESVAVDGQPLRMDAGIRYPSSRQRVVFSFVGLSLAVPGRVRYRYRLDGYDADWSPPTESREAAYTNLAPATYTFHIMASNSDGLWNGVASSVPFDVEPRFWQTWWFRLTGLFLAAGAIFSGFRYRVGRVRAALNLRFEERLAERTRIAQELHDTLLQGFLSVSMQVHVAADLLPEQSPSRPLLMRALQLMQQVIDEGRNTVRGLRMSSTTYAPLETALSQIKQEVGADDNADFRVVVEGRRRELHPILRDEVYRIGREALINAFRHARARHIELELNYSADGFRLFVRDDGIGIDEQVLDGGRDGHWGLVGIRERAERIGAQLHVFSRPSAGTEVELDVPSKLAFRPVSRK
jgi:signal transduction histidine kinase/ligand-binding sensor domain-containing protein